MKIFNQADTIKRALADHGDEKTANTQVALAFGKYIFDSLPIMTLSIADVDDKAKRDGASIRATLNQDIRVDMPNGRGGYDTLIYRDPEALDKFGRVYREYSEFLLYVMARCAAVGKSQD